jgi:hypothetical protein
LDWDKEIDYVEERWLEELEKGKPDAILSKI